MSRQAATVPWTWSILGAWEDIFCWLAIQKNKVYKLRSILLVGMKSYILLSAAVAVEDNADSAFTARVQNTNTAEMAESNYRGEDS